MARDIAHPHPDYGFLKIGALSSMRSFCTLSTLAFVDWSMLRVTASTSIGAGIDGAESCSSCFGFATVFGTLLSRDAGAGLVE
jgi:hypothetical protein